MVPISQIQQLPEFLETAGKFMYHLPLFPNFRKFWLNGKRPLILCTINFIAEKMNELLAHFVRRQSQGGLVKYQLL